MLKSLSPAVSHTYTYLCNTPVGIVAGQSAGCLFSSHQKEKGSEEVIEPTFVRKTFALSAFYIASTLQLRVCAARPHPPAPTHEPTITDVIVFSIFYNSTFLTCVRLFHWYTIQQPTACSIILMEATLKQAPTTSFGVALRSWDCSENG